MEPGVILGAREGGRGAQENTSERRDKRNVVKSEVVHNQPRANNVRTPVDGTRHQWNLGSYWGRGRGGGGHKKTLVRDVTREM